jgi:hypothetical protein
MNSAPLRVHSLRSTAYSALSVLAVGSVAGLFAFGVGAEPESLAGNPAPTFVDTDTDGLPDDFESYLNLVSTNPAWDALPTNADSDGDGQPDGFEFCLSHRAEVVSPGSTHPVVPTITIGAHQVADQIVVSIFLIPAAVSQISDFQFVAAVPNGGGGADLVNLTDFLGVVVEAVDYAYWGAYGMAVFQFRIPAALVTQYQTLAIAAIGRVGPYAIGDSLTLTAAAGKTFRWHYVRLKGDEGGAAGVSEPLDPSVPNGWTTAEVCGSVDIQVPTETPGLLASVVQALGCTSGSYACNGGVCSMGGAASQPKLVLDVDLLLGP